jgi:novobiocin biosynthesis protein NovU/D-mycarose 3-C-methyltransferase
MTELLRRLTRCRICRSADVQRFLSLGPTPLANSFLKPEQLDQPEEYFPLDLALCGDCGLVQLLQVVDPARMFSNYLYLTSTSQQIPKHFAAYAEEVVDRFFRSKQDLFIEIGSNDGTLLRAAQAKGVRVLGVEPATNIAKVANERGIPTLNRFFHRKAAEEIAAQHGKAQAIVANNVVAHIDDVADLAGGLEQLLAPEGVFVFEVPYLADMVAKVEFDTAYHEHLSYFALHPLTRLFASVGMEIFDARRVGVHGGSVRVFARRSRGKGGKENAEALLREEAKLGLTEFKTFQRFAQQSLEVKARLVRMLTDFAAQGTRVAGYGAPAKGNTLLNFCGIGPDLVAYVQDTTPIKQGLFTPGTRIPVVAPAHFQSHPPEVALLLAWNFEAEILAKEQGFRARGGKFLIPVPTPRLV